MPYSPVGLSDVPLRSRTAGLHCTVSQKAVTDTDFTCLGSVTCRNCVSLCLLHGVKVFVDGSEYGINDSVG